MPAVVAGLLRICLEGTTDCQDTPLDGGALAARVSKAPPTARTRATADCEQCATDEPCGEFDEKCAADSRCVEPGVARELSARKA